MRNLVSRWCAIALLIVPLATSAAWAQTFTGGVRGVVTDSGGIVPGVTVTLINEGNGATRDSVSNDRGLYDFSAVPPGTYTIKAELTGFKTFESKGVRVQTQQFVTMDVKLDVGQLQETITVTGAAPLIDTSNASTGSVIDSKQLEALPSAGRSAFLFAVTVPTVVASGDAQFNRQQDQTNASLLSLGGGARRANNYLVDGVPITDMRNRATANPNMEAIEGVNVQVHQYDAETGRTGGGTFNVATKSGGNNFAGSLFYQTRPRWGASNNFFSELADVPLPKTYFHQFGGGFGGPVLKNRTFFWGSVEGYGSNTTRNAPSRLPTTRERNGDFSQTFNSSGQLVEIYDPLTGDPATGLGRTAFPGNIIPANRINPVAQKMLSYLPTPTRDVSNGSNNFDSIAEINDRAVMYTGKVDHRFTDKVSLAGFYLYNKTDEPCANSLYDWKDEKRFVDPNDYILKRRVHALALNNTWLPGNNTVATLRYGWTKFQDQNTLSIEYDPSQLGFASSFLSPLQVKKFPQVTTLTDYKAFGAIDPNELFWNSWSANGTISRLFGSHTFKAGVDYRNISVVTQSFAGGAGRFAFTRLFTSSNPITTNATSGNAVASMILGYPAANSDSGSTVTVSSPFNAWTNYYGAYIQDDWRVNSKFTLNYGVRLEHEDGLKEANNGFTVGFDRTLNPGGALGAVVNPQTGKPIRGGLMYAGVNGNPEVQGDQPAVKFSPRVGMVYSLNPKTVVRAGYGIYWAPWNYQAVGANNYGNIGFTQVTQSPQPQFVPTVSLTNPFPNGILTPTGNAGGALTGVGSQIEFIDQDKGAPSIHQYSLDIARELPGNVAIGFEYVGATGRNLNLGGSNDGVININQVPSQYLSLGQAGLTEQVANPFFGLPAGQGKSVTSPTIQRRELLRPFPQFNDILMRQTTLGESQYHAAVFKLEKRMTNGWGGRINYTYSRLKDNQFGESNFFSSASTEMQNVDLTKDDYGVAAEYAVSLLDVPHKISIAPIFELPFGEGKRWASGGVGAMILGDITVSAIIGLESGFPIQVRNSTNASQLFTRTQYANPGTGEAETDGTRSERIAPPVGGGCNAGNDCGIGLWLNAAAFSAAPSATLGTLPRTLPDIRTPHRNNVDFVAAKQVRMGGNRRGELRFEVLNLTNTVKVTGPVTTVGSSTFGQIRTQSGFMRLTQLTFRFSF
jgi:hypothetical protein